MKNLFQSIELAVERGDLLKTSQQNLSFFLEGVHEYYARKAIEELVEGEYWQELNNRFYKTVEFGTGGLRGRTLGGKITQAEVGRGMIEGCPEFPCAGTASMNLFNVGRAIRAMIAYVQELSKEKVKFGFAHDTRHFSRLFAEKCAQICNDLGCDAYLFESARSTPQLSFLIRELNLDAGVVLTASHNPSHDNGFKAYFRDGAQLVSPHSERVMDYFKKIKSDNYTLVSENERGQLYLLGNKDDDRYIAKLKTLLLRPNILSEGTGTKVVFTNLHGTGGHVCVPLLKNLGFEVLTVPEQDTQDGRFPTVKSPNPENSEALEMALQLAKKSFADVVIGTDPDSDRMGVCVREKEGSFRLLTGNQIGSLMAWYRIKTMFEIGWLSDANRSRAVLIKTLVTTELQRAIGEDFGVNVVDTLTGFKYIADKLEKYEKGVPTAQFQGNYRELTEETSRKLRLNFSRFFIFGGEESYGYLGADFIRDKDANMATLMFAEVVSYAKSLGQSVGELLDSLYEQYGYYSEVGKSIILEGAEGAEQIQNLIDSYSKKPPKKVGQIEVVEVRNYATEVMYDDEGDQFPPTGMLMVELANGYSFAVRPSGTEPKIKYYLFGKSQVEESLSEVKESVAKQLEILWTTLELDAYSRMK